VVLHEPDVALSDLALSVETFAFALIGRRLPSAHRPLRTVTALLFLWLGASSLLGSVYHGFFPLGTATAAGRTVWILTMLSVGGAATMVWMLGGVLTGRPPRRVAPVATLLFAAYLLFLYFVDYGFRVSIAFSIPPLLALLGVFMWKMVRGRSPGAPFGIAAILVMFAASALQQLHIGLHPRYFNHNALYHLIQGIALALLFNALRCEAREQRTDADAQTQRR
jgi:hypothetical protein